MPHRYAPVAAATRAETQPKHTRRRLDGGNTTTVTMTMKMTDQKAGWKTGWKTGKGARVGWVDEWMGGWRSSVFSESGDPPPPLPRRPCFDLDFVSGRAKLVETRKSWSKIKNSVRQPFTYFLSNRTVRRRSCSMVLFSWETAASDSVGAEYLTSLEACERNRARGGEG